MKNSNMIFKMDGETTDMDLIRRYNLDPALEGSKHIDKAVRQAVYDENVRDAIRGGLSPEAAKASAARYLSEANKLASLMG